MEKNTSIQIKESTWFRLNIAKNMGESFDKLINRMMDEIIK